MGAYQRFGQRLGHLSIFAKVMKHIAPHVDRALSRITGGRITFANTVLPTLVLVHRGARSGKEYRTPLSFIRVDDGFGLAASNWGGQNHPGWSYNLVAHPDVDVVYDGETVPVRARRVSDEEKAKLWPAFLTIWPAYDTYKARAAHRNIKVFVLERR